MPQMHLKYNGHYIDTSEQKAPVEIKYKNITLEPTVDAGEAKVLKCDQKLMFSDVVIGETLVNENTGEPYIMARLLKVKNKFMESDIRIEMDNFHPVPKPTFYTTVYTGQPLDIKDFVNLHDFENIIEYYEVDSQGQRIEQTHINTGSFRIKFMFKEPNIDYVWGDTDDAEPRIETWTIQRKPITKPTFAEGQNSLVYNGSLQSPDINYHGSESWITEKGTLESTIVGTYSIKWYLKDIDNTVWEDGTSDGYETFWYITRKEIKVPYISGGTFKYNGTAQTITIKDESEWTVRDVSSIISAINAGTYNVYWNLVDTNNTMWKDDGTWGTKSESWNIEKLRLYLPYSDPSYFDGSVFHTQPSYNGETYSAVKRPFYHAPVIYNIDNISSDTELLPGDIINVPYSGTSKNINLPAGKYFLECWGAGSHHEDTEKDGYGGYSHGILNLSEMTIIYCVCGGQGSVSSSYTTVAPGGYNGGGNGYGAGGLVNQRIGLGGAGATHIATIDGVLSSLSNQRDSIIIVAGGAGSDVYSSTTAEKEYTDKTRGAGGGVNGINGNRFQELDTGGTWTYATPSVGGSQISGGAGATAKYQSDAPVHSGFDGTFGQGGNSCSDKGTDEIVHLTTVYWGGGAGGGGYYGGGGGTTAFYAHTTASRTKQCSVSGAGGSGYVNENYLTDAETEQGTPSRSYPDGFNGYIRITVIDIDNFYIDKYYNGNYIAAQGTFEGVNVGSYPVTYSLIDTNNTIWENDTITPYSSPWSISQRSITVPTVIGSYAYNGSAQTVNFNNPDSAHITMTSGTTTATNAGTYSTIWELNDPINTAWSDGSTTPKTVNWTINKRAGFISVTSITNSTQGNANNSSNPANTDEAVLIYHSNHGGTISATANNNYNAVSGYDSTTATITKGSSDTGSQDRSTTITITCAATQNYTSASTTCSVYRVKTSSCVSGDTLILMGDGTEKPISEVKRGDSVMTYNMDTGVFEPQIASIYWDESNKPVSRSLRLTFDNNSVIKVIATHGFFDRTLNTYVYIDYENYNDYIGHDFVAYTPNGYVLTKLVSGEVVDGIETQYSIETSYNDNFITNGILSITQEPVTGRFEYFKFSDEDIKWDPVDKQQSIDEHGLFTYEEWKDIIPDEEMFYAWNGPYFKILMDKGLVTIEDIYRMLEDASHGL